MSKKSNAEKKELAKRPGHLAKKKGNRLTATSIGFPFMIHPALSLLNQMVDALFPKPLWVCDPCRAELTLLQPNTAGPVYCPKCKQPMRLVGYPPPAPPKSKVVEVQFEPMLPGRRPAPQIAGPATSTDNKEGPDAPKQTEPGE